LANTAGNEYRILVQNSNLPLSSSQDLTLSMLSTIDNSVGLVLGFVMATACSEVDVAS